MKYDIMGKKIVSTSTGHDGITIGFDDGVTLILKAKAAVTLDHKGRLLVYPTIEVSTYKIELKAEEES